MEKGEKGKENPAGGRQAAFRASSVSPLSIFPFSLRFFAYSPFLRFDRLIMPNWNQPTRASVSQNNTSPAEKNAKSAVSPADIQSHVRSVDGFSLIVRSWPIVASPISTGSTKYGSRREMSVIHSASGCRQNSYPTFSA